MRTGFRVDGLNSVVRALQDLGLGLDAGDLKQAFGAIADRGARLAAVYAPKLTGALAGDIRGNRAKNKAVVIAGRVRIPYAGVINYGRTGRGGAQFMQRADQTLQPWAVDQLESEINRLIRKKNFQ